VSSFVGGKGKPLGRGDVLRKGLNTNSLVSGGCHFSDEEKKEEGPITFDGKKKGKYIRKIVFCPN